MGAETDYGRKRPNGRKIMELRKEKGLKQEALAKDVCSVRVLRDIERKNHPVPTTTITAIAAKLKVNSGDITLSSPDAPLTNVGPAPFASPTKDESLLKLRTIRSATELNNLASRADEYEWSLGIDPGMATAADMQAVMTTVHRLIQKFDLDVPIHPSARDEFDQQLFGEIPRLARLQDLLTKLGANGVNVIAGTYTHSSVRDLMERENSDFGEFVVRVPGKSTRHAFKYVTRLQIRFVSSDVEEDVVPINPGRSLKDFELDDEIPF